MIWLSLNSGIEQRSIYFDLRNIEFHRVGSQLEGTAQGLLGDGQNEYWGEVKIGAESEVKILPLWTEDGQVEELSPHIDEDDLKQQLLAAILAKFAHIVPMAAADRLNSELIGCASPGNFFQGSGLDWSEHLLFTENNEKTHSGINQPLSA